MLVKEWLELVNPHPRSPELRALLVEHQHAYQHILDKTDNFYRCVQFLRHERTPIRMLQVMQAAQQLEQALYQPVMIRWTAVQVLRKETVSAQLSDRND